MSWLKIFPVKKKKNFLTIKKFDEVVGKIKTKNYDMSSTVKCDKLCGNCDFRHYCNS